MKNKKEFVKCFEYGKYLAFTLATIFVIISQFKGGSIWITLALSLYTVAFGFLFATLVIRLVELYGAENTAKSMDAEIAKPQEFSETEPQEDGGHIEVVNCKAEKAKAYVGAIFFGLFTIFTFIVLILY